MSTSANKLRNALMANAVFSFTSGIIIVIFSSQLSTVMNIANNATLLIIGIGLLIFASTIVFIRAKKEVHAKSIKSIIVQDWIWVIGSAIMLIFRPLGISTVGNIIIGIIAIIVMLLAILQMKSLRQAAR